MSFLLKRVNEGRQKFVRPQPPSLDKVRLAITLLYPEMLRISRGSQSPAINQFGRGMIWPVRWWWWLWRGEGEGGEVVWKEEIVGRENGLCREGSRGGC